MVAGEGRRRGRSHRRSGREYDRKPPGDQVHDESPFDPPVR